VVEEVFDEIIESIQFAQLQDEIRNLEGFYPTVCHDNRRQIVGQNGRWKS
jgi:hypothetical protein